MCLLEVKSSIEDTNKCLLQRSNQTSLFVYIDVKFEYRYVIMIITSIDC